MPSRCNPGNGCSTWVAARVVMRMRSAGRGIEVVGVDIAQAFVDLANASAPAGASFVRGDARDLEYDGEFDVALSLCQGGFGLVHDDADDDRAVLDGMARAVRPGGRIVLSAFSGYFAVRFLEESDAFDAAHRRQRRADHGAQRGGRGAERRAAHVVLHTPRAASARHAVGLASSTCGR